MTRLLIHVEGETEETFVNEVLSPHLFQCGYEAVGARLVGNARQRDRRGGIRGWSAMRAGIVKHLKSDRACLVTMMVDYYGMPQKGERAWPGRAAAAKLPFLNRAITVENALHADICKKFGTRRDPERFVPYVMMHEFEGMLFSDCTRFADGIARPDLAVDFQAIRDSFNSPEEINDSPETHPSRRLELLIAGYEKPLLGALAALEIGLDGIRAACPHFRTWLERLEQWPMQNAAVPKKAPKPAP